MFDFQDDTKHRDGIEWFDAPIPPRMHKCFVQTEGYIGLFDCVQRCACGAIRNPGISKNWMDRNSRREGLSRRIRRPSPLAWLTTAYVVGFALFVAGLFTHDIPTLLAFEIPALLLLGSPAVFYAVPSLNELI